MMTVRRNTGFARALWGDDTGRADSLTLLELNALVRQTVETAMPGEYWVETELSECRESRGHCYMELVQKDELSHTPVARAQAKCWRQTWQRVQPCFEQATGQPLHAGLKVRLRVYAQFHEAYGFSWIVTDIDPTFTLGDMERRRRDIIRRLKEEGIFDMQKELRLPLFCQRVAVVSSATAAGYGDFCHQLADNRYGFRFLTQLFPAVMQGEQVEQSIIAALNAIYDGDFDCVVIIRGGGATADLSGFDTLALAENVAQFPLPVITGIGHDRDESVIDMVSHTRVKTPTAAADLLVSHLKQVWDGIDDAQQRITAQSAVVTTRQDARIGVLQERLTAALRRRLDTARHLLDNANTRMANAAGQRLTAGRHLLDNADTRLANAAGRRLADERHRLDLTGERLHLLDPALLLKRGYSITLKDGKAVRDARQLKKGDTIVTRLEKGTIKSEII